MTTSTVLDVQEVTPAVGAIIGGLDLRAPLDDNTVRAGPRLTSRPST